MTPIIDAESWQRTPVEFKRPEYRMTDDQMSRLLYAFTDEVVDNTPGSITAFLQVIGEIRKQRLEPGKPFKPIIGDEQV